MKRNETKARAPRRYKLPVEQIDGRRKAPLLWAETLDGILGAMDGEVTPPRLSLAHTAASLTVRLGKIDAEVAEGREPAADHVRLAGQLNRTLRSLGIVESGSLFSETGARAGAGPPSRQKKLVYGEFQGGDQLAWFAATDEERWACMTPIQQENHIDQQDWNAWDFADRHRREGEPRVPEPRNPYHERQEELLAEAKLKKNSYTKKSFATHRDSPRRDE